MIKMGEHLWKLNSLRPMQLHVPSEKHGYDICLIITFETLVSGLALWTKLAPFSPFILITWPAHRKATLITGHKQVSIHRESHAIAANLTDLAIQVLQSLGLHKNQTTLVHINQHLDENVPTLCLCFFCSSSFHGCYITSSWP